MSWTLNVPHRSRDESLIDTAAHARHLDGDDRAVARELALAAYENGMRTAGQLLDSLETSSPAARRASLDRSRLRAGLESTAEADIRDVTSLRTATPDSSVVYVHGENGVILERRADDDEVAAAEERRRATEREAREQQRRIDLADHEDAERAQRDALRRELPEHLRGLV